MSACVSVSSQPLSFLHVAADRSLTLRIPVSDRLTSAVWRSNLLALPRNPLFATDEQLRDDFDPRVNVFVSVNGAKRMGRQQMAYVALQRQTLLVKARSGAMEPDVYASRLLMLLRLAWSDLVAATKWVGGGYLNTARDRATPATSAEVSELAELAIEFMLGPTFRVSAEEQRSFLVSKGGAQYHHHHHHHHCCCCCCCCCPGGH